MSRKVTIKFDKNRNWRGTFADGSEGRFRPEPGKEYCVSLEEINDTYVQLIMPDGLAMPFYHPGESTSYHVVREGWDETEAVFPVGPLVKPSAKPARMPPILESTLILDIEPTKHSNYTTNTEYLIYKLPRTLNGLLVDRGYGSVKQETVCDRANPECVGELVGVASFMLTSKNNDLRYNCISFRIDNKTTKKNLISEYGRASVRLS